MEKEIIKLRLIRHGQTAFNAEGRYMGRTDVELCDDGRQAIRKMYENAQWEDDVPLFSSPMKRCLETAKIIFPDRTPVIFDGLREMDFGIFEGKMYEELQNMKEFTDFVSTSGRIAPPEGESREDFTARVTDAVKKCCESIREAGRDFGVIVMHGGTIMALMSYLDGGDYYSYLPKNGGGFLLTLDKEFRLLDHEKI